MADEMPPLIAEIKGDASDLLTTLAEVEAELSAFADKTYTATLGIDTQKALEELAAFLAAADSMTITIPVTLDMGGALAQLAALKAAGGISSGVGGGGAGGAGGNGGGVGIALAPNGGGGGGGGGGGLAGLLTLLGFGNAASGGMGLLGGLGGGLAGVGTLGGIAGLGPESLLTTLLGIGGSAAGGVVGGGLLGLGTAGVMGVGMGTDLAGIGQAMGDVKQYNGLLNNLNQAIAVYGANSTQAALAQYQMNQFMQDLTPAAQSAIIATNATANAFHAMFDKATGAAEATGANIINQMMQVGEKFLPIIGKFAAENMTIIQSALQPLFSWIQGPGLQIFTELEKKFQSELPTAMHAFDQGVELLVKTLGFLAPYTGRLITFIDDLLTKLNSPSGFAKFSKDMATAIGIFRDWEGLIKAVGTAIYELFHHDAGTGTAIVVTLTNMVNQFNAWAKTVSGGDRLHALLEAHKQEILSILALLPRFLSIFGQIELTVAPPLITIVSILAQIANILFHIPFVGTILAWAAALAFLSSKSVVFAKLFSVIGNLLKPLIADLLGTAVAEDTVAVSSDAVGASGLVASLGFYAMAAAMAVVDAIPIVALIVGIAAAIAGLVIGIMYLVNHWKQVWTEVKKIFDDAVKFLRSGFGTLLLLPLGLVGALIILALHWQQVWAAIKSITESVVRFFLGIPGTIAHVWTDITGAIHAAWSDIASWVHSTVIQPIVNYYTAIPGTIAHVWSDVVSGIHAAWSTVANWVKSNVIDPVVAVFNTIAGAISGAISTVEGIIEAPFKAAYSIIMGIIHGIEGGITAIINGINAVKNAGPSIGGVSLNPFHYLADGGIITSPMLAMVGESGPEAVIPLNNAARMMEILGQLPRTSGLSGIGGGLISPLSPSASAAGPTTVLNVTTPLQVNGQTLAQIVTQYQLRGARSTGSALGQYAGGTQQQTATSINTNAPAR